MTKVSDLGEMRRQKLDSEDITDRYFDTKAEAANLEAREEALRKLYKEKIGGSKLTELLEVDRELTSVRGQINVLKGQLQRWDGLVEFATITLTLIELKGYVPTTAPDFGTTLGRAFDGSLDALVWTGKTLVLVTVVLAPWLAVLAVLGFVVWLIVRFFATFRRPPVLKPVAAPPPPSDNLEQSQPS